MFRSYAHLQVEICTSEINMTSNTLVGIMYNGSRYLENVQVVSVCELLLRVAVVLGVVFISDVYIST
jgi:hypothetical protein